MDLLDVSVSHHDGWIVVRATGQLDVATAPVFRQQLVEAAFSAETALAVDLDGLEFVDSMGLGVLVGALKRARSHGTSFALVCTRERILRLLDLTRLAEIMPVVATIGDLPRGDGDAPG